MGDLEKYKCGLTKSEVKELLNANLDHYLWNKPCIIWDDEDLYNIVHGINKRSYKRHYKPKKDPNAPKEKKVKLSRPIRYVKVLVTFNDGTQKAYASVKSVADKFKINQSTVSKVLKGTRNTTKFKAISKIN